MNIFDELFWELMKHIEHKISVLLEPLLEEHKCKKKCIECKYNRKYARKYEKKYKSFRSALYCLLEQKMAQIRSLESENASLKNTQPVDKSVFIREIAIMCRDILFD